MSDIALEAVLNIPERAFLEGYLFALDQFSTWKDGVQVLGSQMTPVSELSKSAIADTREAYLSFLERMRRKFEEEKREERAAAASYEANKMDVMGKLKRGSNKFTGRM